jgi:cytidine deaminase
MKMNRKSRRKARPQSARNPAADRSRLFGVARAAMKHAYAPYSHFRVGAAVLLRDGRVFAGCNVENASYGLTVCAERNAIFAAVAASAKKPEVVAVAVCNDRGAPCAPCGACRQVIAEFGPAALVWYRGADGMVGRTMPELLLDGFKLGADKRAAGGRSSAPSANARD